MVKFSSQHTKDQINTESTETLDLCPAKTENCAVARKLGAILSSQRPVENKLEGYANSQGKYLRTRRHNSGTETNGQVSLLDLIHCKAQCFYISMYPS